MTIHFVFFHLKRDHMTRLRIYQKATTALLQPQVAIMMAKTHCSGKLTSSNHLTLTHNIKSLRKSEAAKDPGGIPVSMEWQSKRGGERMGAEGSGSESRREAVFSVSSMWNVTGSRWPRLICRVGPLPPPIRAQQQT